MNPKSSIAKGKRFENYIADRIEKSGLGTCRRESGSGNGQRKGDLFWSLPYTPELKNQKKISLLDTIEQSQQQAMGYQNWLVIVRNPKKPEFEESFVVMDFERWLELEKRDREPKIKEPDRELKFHLTRLAQNIKSVLKLLE